MSNSMSSCALRTAGSLVVLLTMSSFYFTYLNYKTSDLQQSSIILPEDFSWMSYVDQNSGLADLAYTFAIGNFHDVGKQKGQPYMEVNPSFGDIEKVQKKIDVFNRACPSKSFDPSSQNLVIYHVSESDTDFHSLVKLNLMLFLTTIDQDPCLSAAPTFYVFNVANGAKNTLFSLIPEKSNVAVLNWYQRNPTNVMYNCLRTLEVITPRSMNKFGAVFLLSVDVRGPLTGRHQNEWLQKYRFLLDRNNVAVVSPIIQCHEHLKKVPELSAYSLAVRTEYMLLVLEHFQSAKYKPASSDASFSSILNNYFSLGSQSLLHKWKFRAASIAQFLMDPRHTHYNDDCRSSNDVKALSGGVLHGEAGLDNTDAAAESVYAHHSWCHDATLQMFVPWSKLQLRTTEYKCPNYVTSMYQYLARFGALYPTHTAQIESVMGSISIYETVYADGVRDVFVQYNEELRRLHLATNRTGTTNANVVATTSVRPVLDTNPGVLGAVTSSFVHAMYNSNPNAVQTTDTSTITEGEVKNMQFTHTHNVPYTSTNHYTHYTYDTTPDNSQVCFLVRTSAMHDRVQPDNSLRYTETDVFDLIASLQKQTNPNWRAYLFLTDDRPFSDRLREIVLGARDSRVVFFDIHPTHRPKFTKVDGGYTATDFALKHILHDLTCKYISVTNGDNTYGSEVVQRVLEYSVALYGKSTSYTKYSTDANAVVRNINTTEPSSLVSQLKPPSRRVLITPPMLLAPLDSRNFNIAYQNQIYKRVAHDEACRGLNALLEFNMLTYTTQPVPRLGRVDLASLFLNREALLEANVLFANFTDPVEYSCHGCQDGYLAEHLTTKMGWDFARMPIDGLKTIVFHGPSPTLCVAAGNVWFDHPAVNQVGCYARGAVHALRIKDRSGRNPIYDWPNYDRYSGVCIRLSEYGLRSLPRPDSYITTVKSRLRKGVDNKHTLLGFLMDW